MPRQAKRDIDMDAPAFLGRRPGGSGSGVYAEQDGPVVRYTASSFNRSLEFPAKENRRLAFILAIAVAISIALIVAYNLAVMGDSAQTQVKVAAAIDRGVTLDLPKLEDYAGKTNEAMMASFKDAGYTIYDNSNEEDRNVDGFDVFKLASDVDPEAAGNAYAEGIENLGAVDAAYYLSGSWRFLVSRVNNAEIRLRYADFEATDATSAIQSAIDAQGFKDVDVSGIALDTMGNSNVSGSFKIDKVTYEYTISACDLSQVYDIDGAPENAQFVGIRVTPES